MPSHTPGPWTVRGPTGYLNQTAIDPAIGCAYGSGDEVQANAALIAAAPELLEALVAILPHYEGMTEDGWGENYAEAKRLIAAAHAAVRKAQA